MKYAASRNPAGRPPKPPLERFFGHVMPEPNSGCWLWTSFTGTDGYAVFFNKRGLSQRAHRFAYEQFVGPIPDGNVIHHRCRNIVCVNPDHLEPMPWGEHSRLSFSPLGARTHCAQGHEFTPENTYWTRRNGRITGRKCRQCHAAFERDRRARLRAAA